RRKEPMTLNELEQKIENGEITKAEGLTAYHEAAHTVVAYLFDQDYQAVSIIADEPRPDGSVSAGHVACDLFPCSDMQSLSAAVLTLLAGPAMEYILTHDENFLRYSNDPADDIKRARRGIELLKVKVEHGYFLLSMFQIVRYLLEYHFTVV